MSRAYLYAVMLAALLVVPLASGAAADLPPAPTIDSTPTNPSATGTATLSFSDADPLLTFRCQIDGGAFSLCTSPATYSGLDDGSHTFGVKAVDILPNESDVVSYTWSVDTTPPPAPTITAQPSDPSNDSSPAFQFTDTEEGVSFQCELDSGGFAACASPVAYTRASGRQPHLHRAGDRRCRQHLLDELRLDDRHGGAHGHARHQAAELLQRPDADLCFQRQRGHS